MAKCQKEINKKKCNYERLAGGIMKNEERQEVIVKDIKMSFDSMVIFMVKWALASIPALIILVLIGIVSWLIIGAFRY